MPLESVAGILDDDSHVRLDRVVLNTCDGIIDPSIFGLAAVFLLVTIVETSEGTLDPQYGNNTNAKALLQAEEELFGKLKDAWTKKKFEEIRNLSTIYVFFDAAC
jgi:hypothetical protein